MIRYAKEVIDLMAAFPGRPFKVIEIRRYVETGLRIDIQRRESVRVSVHRVIDALIKAGCVRRTPRSKAGRYEWVQIRNTTP